MPFEVNNFAIRTWNVVLVSECHFFQKCRFRLQNLHFGCGRAFSLEIYSFTFGTLLNSGILRSGSTKCRFWLRKLFLSQKMVCMSRF